jgi:hypothetical protein
VVRSRNLSTDDHVSPPDAGFCPKTSSRILKTFARLCFETEKTGVTGSQSSREQKRTGFGDSKRKRVIEARKISLFPFRPSLPTRPSESHEPSP